LLAKEITWVKPCAENARLRLRKNQGIGTEREESVYQKIFTRLIFIELD
jgi:hypothetical protein